MITCPCGATAEAPRSGSVGEIRAAAPDWQRVSDVSNGLEFVWICPDCAVRVEAAVRGLARVFGLERVTRIHVGPIVKLIREKDAAS